MMQLGMHKIFVFESHPSSAKGSKCAISREKRLKRKSLWISSSCIIKEDSESEDTSKQWDSRIFGDGFEHVQELEGIVTKYV